MIAANSRKVNPTLVQGMSPSPDNCVHVDTVHVGYEDASISHELLATRSNNKKRDV